MDTLLWDLISPSLGLRGAVNPKPLLLLSALLDTERFDDLRVLSMSKDTDSISGKISMVRKFLVLIVMKRMN